MPDPCHDLWTVKFLGVQAVQFWADLLLWEKLLDAHPTLRTCVEIGALHGGLSLYLLLQSDARLMQFTTFDLNPPAALDTTIGRQLHLRSHFVQGDVFDDYGAGGDLKTILADASAHPLVLLCDGGNKPKEFQTFVPLLWAGDLVAVHDWGNEFTDLDVEPVRALVERVCEAECVEHGALTAFYRRV